jgi:S-formylglutathione hydrolase FrmB
MMYVLFVVTLTTAPSRAATVEDLDVRSDKMGRGIPITVITPDAYSQSADARYPVVYALHGAGGDNVSFAGSDRALRALADRYQVVVVCPDGGLTSWWLDSPIDPTYQYETFVAKELVAFMDQRFRTLATRDKRAIAGGSMGGHGACYIGIRNKAVFGAVGNIFGGVDLRPFPDNWDIKLRIGSKQEQPENWERFSVVNNLGGLKDGELAIISMVGSSDFFLQVNRDFNALLQKRGIQHYYIEAKGAHDVPFQNEAFGVMFRFFDHYFKTGRGAL